MATLTAISFEESSSVGDGYPKFPVVATITVDRFTIYLNNGLTWSRTYTTGSGECKGFAFGNGVFVACGDGGIYRSTDYGVNWTQTSSYGFDCVAFGNGVFVAGSCSDKGVYRSTDDGLNWVQTGKTSQNYDCCAYGSGVFLACGDVIIRSTDGGQTWEDTEYTYTCKSIAFGNGVFVACGDGGIYRSTDYGVNWTQTSSYGFDCVAFGNGVFVAGSSSGDSGRSFDGGTTWEEIYEEIYVVAYGCGVFISGMYNYISISRIDYVFDITYKRNGVLTDDFINAGDIGVEVTGIGSISGTATDYYRIYAGIVAEATGYNGTYDGESHGITVVVREPETGAIVKYGTSEGRYPLDESPEIKDVGTQNVYYKITADGYVPYTGRSSIIVLGANLTDVTCTQNGTLTYTGSDQQPSVNTTATSVAEEVVTFAYSKSEDGTYSTIMSSYKNAGTYALWYKASAPNHITTSPASTPITVGKATIDASGITFSDMTYIYDGTEHTLTARNIPDGITVSYQNNSRTEVGVQTAIANFTPVDANNYNVSPAMKTATMSVMIGSSSLNITLGTGVSTVSYSVIQDGVVKTGTITTNSSIPCDICFSWSTTATAKEGYTLTSGSSSASGTMTSAGASFSPTTTANEYTVTLDKAGGTGGTTDVSVTYDRAMPTITIPTRTGYVFGGYYYGNVQYYNLNGAPGRNWDIASDATLTAKWAGYTYTVTLDKNGGSGGTSQVTATYGSAMPTPISLPTREGYTFGGYYYGDVQYYTANGSSACNWDIATYATLTAKWTANQYTVTLDSQGGSGGTSQATATYGSAMPTPITIPTKEGYTFGGYYYGDVQYYTASGASARNWDIATDATLTAKWTANQYTVTLDSQGGTGGTSQATATYGSAMPPITIPTKTGHGFGGYYYVSGGVETQYYTASGASARNWDIATDATLTAKWTANQYTVTLDATGGTGGTSQVTATSGSAMPTPISLPTREGYTFGGYYYGDVQYYTANGSSARNWDIASDATLTAKWTANQYTVTLDAQGGSGGTSQATATYGSAMPPITIPTKEGYAFGGYYYVSGGVETQYYTASGASARNWDIATYATLTAKWTTNEYTVTLDATGGTGGTSQVTATYGSAMPTPISLPTREGYTFGGYYYGDVQYYTANGSSARNWDIEADTTLTVKWTSIVYAVTLDAQSGGIVIGTSPESQTKSITITFGQQIGTLPGARRTQSQTSVFNGWYTTAGADATTGIDSGVRIYETDVVDENLLEKIGTTSIKLYARFDMTGITVTFDSNGGSYVIPSTQISVIHGSRYVDGTYKDTSHTPLGGELPVSEKIGYEFKGWCLVGDVDVITSETVVEKTTEHTLVAKWEQTSSTVTLNPNGTVADPATVFPGTVSLIAGNLVGSLPTAERGGFTHDGWFTASIGGQEITSATIYDGTYNLLYAHWIGSQTLVHLKANKPVSATEEPVINGPSDFTKSYSAGTSTLGDVPTASLVGYTFDGWYDAASGGTKYTSVSILPYAGNFNLYAHWTVETKTITVTFDSDGGSTPSPSSITATVGGYYGQLPMVTRSPGYTFEGWFTGKGGTGSQIESGGSVTSTYNFTVYAKWEPTDCTVVFYKNNGASPESKTIPYGELIWSYKPVDPSKTGETFSGWKLRGSSPESYLTAQTLCTGNATYDAQFSGNKVTVTFVSNGGLFANNAVTSVSVDNPTPFSSITKPSVTRSGYAFYKWFDASTGEEKTGNVTSDTVVYATWTGVSFSVVFHDNKGTSPGSTVTQAGFTYGTPKKLNANTFSPPTGKKFSGWSLSSTGSSVDYVDESYIVNALPKYVSSSYVLDLYAFWSSSTEDPYVKMGVPTSLSNETSQFFTLSCNAPGNDIYLSGNSIAMAYGKDAMAQVIRAAVLTYRGELQYDQDRGIPYWETVFNNREYIPVWKAEVISRIEEFDFVNRVASFDMNVDYSNHRIDYTAVIETNEGSVTITNE